MSNHSFLWINLGVGLLLVLIFLIGKRGFVAPTKLNLKKSGNPASPDSKSMVRAERRISTSAYSSQSDPLEAPMKNLNVLFIYNGHSFDAHEVLGAPAGANMEMVQRYYQAALLRQGADQDFLGTALKAIQSSQAR